MNFSNIEANIDGISTGIILRSTEKEEIVAEFLNCYPNAKAEDITMICIFKDGKEIMIDSGDGTETKED